MIKEKIKTVPLLYNLANFLLMIISIFKSKNIKSLTTFPPGHFYSPIPNLKNVKKYRERIFGEKIDPLGIEIQLEFQIQLLKELAPFFESIPFLENPTDKLRYYYKNSYFGDGDAIILQALLRKFKPKNIVEIGSGFSSAAMLDINDRYLDNTINFTFIEPNPERLTRLLTEQDLKTCTILKEPVQNLSLDVFSSLSNNDILFVDSSHVAKIDSDVLYIMFSILPKLKPGVIIHFHDVIWPFEYPEEWVMKGFSWNESYLLRAFLQFNSNFEILYFNSFIAIRYPDILKETIGRNLTSPGGSIWIRRLK